MSISPTHNSKQKKKSNKKVDIKMTNTTATTTVLRVYAINQDIFLEITVAKVRTNWNLQTANRFDAHFREQCK